MKNLREQFLLDPDVIYLNHGSFGATPEPVFLEYQRWQRELEREPTEFLGRRHDGLMQAARETLAQYVGARAEDLVFTQNVTIALNIVASSLKLGPGDEVLASDHEYGACDRMWRFLAKKNGFRYVRGTVRVPYTTRQDIVDELWKEVTPATKVIFLSHITSPTAVILPVAEVCRRARQAGIMTIIDGAHAPGQIDLDLEAIGADFYGANLHKWLCAPKGAGFLFARPEVQSLLVPLVVSWGYEPATPSGSDFIDHHQWWGTRDIAAFLAVPKAIEFQATHDWASVRGLCHELLGNALRRIAVVTRQEAWYPADDWYSQVASAPLPLGTDHQALGRRLFEEFRVEVPVLEWNGHKLLRVSVQGYNTPRDIDVLIDALERLLKVNSLRRSAGHADAAK